MGDHDDKVFLKRFSGIIAGLVIVTILIIIIATFRDEGPGQENNPSRLAMAAERIAPVAGVRTELPAPEPDPLLDPPPAPSSLPRRSCGKWGSCGRATRFGSRD